MNFIQIALDFIFSPVCGACHKLGEGYLCKNCKQEWQNYLYQNDQTGQFHLLQYEGKVREKLLDYKFQDKAYLSHFFAKLILENEEACKFLKQYDVLLPVPIHPKRKRQRGYNQSELIAKEVAQTLSIQFINDVLIKTIHTQPQSLLNKKKRKQNVQGVYKVENKHKIKEKSVAILDDIYTTGSTTKECKKVLLQAGVKKIGIFTIAKEKFTK